ncbi:unnamed protein product [Natator depressus]
MGSAGGAGVEVKGVVEGRGRSRDDKGERRRGGAGVGLKEAVEGRGGAGVGLTGSGGGAGVGLTGWGEKWGRGRSKGHWRVMWRGQKGRSRGWGRGWGAGVTEEKVDPGGKGPGEGKELPPSCLTAERGRGWLKGMTGQGRGCTKLWRAAEWDHWRGQWGGKETGVTPGLVAGDIGPFPSRGLHFRSGPGWGLAGSGCWERVPGPGPLGGAGRDPTWLAQGMGL